MTESKMTDLSKLISYILEHEKQHYDECDKCDRKNHIYRIAKRLKKARSDEDFKYAEMRGALHGLVLAIQEEIPEKKTTRTLSNAIFRAADIIQYTRKK